MSIQQLVMAVGGRVNDATGGTITYNGDYQIHTFTSSGTFTVTRAGLSSTVVDVLVVGSGDDGYEGGYSENEDDPPGPDGDGGDGGSGGYGGQVVASSTLTLASFNLNTGYSVSVGAPGSSSLTYQSGTLSASAGYLVSGGGGAAGGGNGNAGTNGTTSSITGVSAVYGSSGGGGGGGAGAGTGSGGNGGTNAGSGGSGGSFGNPGNNGAAATGYGSGGGGGGGAGGDYSTLRAPGAGGAGYQGIVVVRFKYQNI